MRSWGLHPLAAEDAVAEHQRAKLGRYQSHLFVTSYAVALYDHVLRATEWTESLRDLVTTILETHLTVRGNRLNVIMKQVTSWAAIIAVPTAVTGFYGQNVPYPGFGRTWGFWVSTLVMIGLAAFLYMVFRRKDWL